MKKPWLGLPLTDARCAICVLEDVFSGAESVGLEQKEKCEVARRVMALLEKEFSLDEMPSVYITKAHRILKEVSGLDDPFSKTREICKTIGVRLASKIKEEARSISNNHDRFRFLVQWSIAANAMDIRTAGTGYNLRMSVLEKRLKKIFDEGLAVDDTKEIFRLVRRSKRVLFVLDNVGEIAIDRLLIEEVRGLGSGVIVAYRGGPLTSDATKEDLLAAGFSPSKVQFIATGPDTLGITFEEMTNEFRNETARADLIIGKGQANFYAFCQYRNRFPGNVASLLRTKCSFVYRLFGMGKNVNIAVLL